MHKYRAESPTAVEVGGAQLPLNKLWGWCAGGVAAQLSDCFSTGCLRIILVGTKAVVIEMPPAGWRSFLSVLASGLALLACQDLAAAPAHRSPAGMVAGVLDARFAGQAVTVRLDSKVKAQRRYALVQLPAVAEASPVKACCVSVKSRLPSAMRDTSSTSVAYRGQLSYSPESGFFGLLLKSTPDAVTRTSANEFQMTWNRERLELKAVHCLSSEGLHIRLLNGKSNEEIQRYHLSLDMAVEPTCTPSIMPIQTTGDV